jgi:hypothetical protein
MGDLVGGRGVYDCEMSGTLHPIHNAVQRGDLLAIKKTLEHGEDINVKDNV